MLHAALPCSSLFILLFCFCLSLQYISYKQRDGQEKLFFSVIYNDICFWLLLSAFHMLCLVLVADSEGRTPLHWAVDRGHFNVVEVLLNRNADVNAKVMQFTITVIYRSVDYSRVF